MIDPAGVQLSVAVGSAHVTVAVQDPESVDFTIFEGHPLMTGFIASETVTVELHVLLSKAFETVRVTLFDPRSEQVNRLLLRVLVTLQFWLLPLSTIAAVSVPFPEASRLRFAFLQIAIRLDSVEFTLTKVDGDDWLLYSVVIQSEFLTSF